MPRVAITIGDPNGIGPEIAVKAAGTLRGGPIEPLLVGDAFVIQEHARRLAHATPLSVEPVAALAPAAFAPGRCDPRAGHATVEYVRAAVDLARRGVADAIVACPMSETAINSAGIAFSGYPGLLAELTGTPREKVFLMLVAAGLRIAHVTLHEGVRQALARIDVNLIVDAALAAVKTTRRLGIPAPRLAVMGINPHAGEGGLFGDEDERITRPAVAELRRRGIACDGPAGADLLLSQGQHDLYLAMFHDQGHIPIKLLSPLRASALSIGTPVHFASVGHGCAYDIAGRGVADSASVLETVALLAATA